MVSPRGDRDEVRSRADRLAEACRPRSEFPHDILSDGSTGLGPSIGGGWRSVEAKADFGPGFYRFDRRYLPEQFPVYGSTIEVLGDDLTHVRRLLAVYLRETLAPDLASTEIDAMPMADIWPSAFKPTRICRRRHRNR